VKLFARKVRKVNRAREKRPGTDVMIFKIFSPKNLAKILAFLTQIKAKLCKKIDHNIGF
jgi:hypothetical protein